jgi:hypothetical protein
MRSPKNDVFKATKEWCLSHSDPEKRELIVEILRESEAIDLRRTDLQMAHGLSVAEADHQIGEEVAGAMRADIWEHLISNSEDARAIAVYAIMMTSLKFVQLTPALEECTQRLESPEMCEAIAITCGCLAQPESRPFLEWLSQECDEIVHDAAIWALNQLPSEKETEEKLVKDFQSFLAGLSAHDFARYDRYEAAS